LAAALPALGLSNNGETSSLFQTARSAAKRLAKGGKGHGLAEGQALAALWAIGCWMQRNPGVKFEKGEQA
jgi:hypothetical protein